MENEEVNPQSAYAPAKDSTGGGAELDTFDNADDGNPQAFDTPQEELKEEKPKEATQADKLEESNDEGKGQEKGKEAKEKDAEGEKEREEGKDEEFERDADAVKKVGGKVKGRLGEKQIEFDEDTQVRVKVDGKYMNVPLSEMRDAYSSITKNKELGEEIQEREIEVQKELDDYVEEREEVVGHLEKIGELLDDKEGNPMDAIYYLLDMTGRNRNDYQRKILHHHLEEVESLQMMSDSERKAYFLEQENEYLKERHETSESSVREIEEQKSFVDNMTRQREAQGISEDEFIDAYKDLVNSGETESDLTPETVIQYAKFLPVVIEAEEIVEGFDPDLLDDDEVVRAVADSIVEDPEITKEELIEILEYSFGKMGGETAIKETGEHGESFYKEARPKQKPKESDHLESFDDFGQYGGNY